MEQHKKQFLEAAGWKTGTVDEFLGLTPEESAIVEIKLALSNLLRERRKELGWSQKRLAETIKSSQSRIAKIESRATSVSSIELLLRALFATNAEITEIFIPKTEPALTIGETVPKSRVAKESFSIGGFAVTNTVANLESDVFEIA